MHPLDKFPTVTIPKAKVWCLFEAATAWLHSEKGAPLIGGLEGTLDPIDGSIKAPTPLGPPLVAPPRETLHPPWSAHPGGYPLDSHMGCWPTGALLEAPAQLSCQCKGIGSTSQTECGSAPFAPPCGKCIQSTSQTCQHRGPVARRSGKCKGCAFQQYLVAKLLLRVAGCARGEGTAGSGQGLSHLHEAFPVVTQARACLNPTVVLSANIFVEGGR